MPTPEQDFPTFFCNLLQSHGLEACIYEDWVMVADNFPAFRAYYSPPPEQNLSGVIDIQVMLAEGVVIEECYAAFGDTENEAIGGALSQFVLTMFHPIIHACCGAKDDDQVVFANWRVGRFACIKTWSGNVALRLSDGLSISVPDDWLDKVADASKTVPFRKGYNWCSLYFSRLNKETPTSDCRLNNKPWPAGSKVTEALDWPLAQGFYGARLFILMKK